MLCSKSIPLGFLLFCLFYHAVNGASPLYHRCFSPENFTANTPYPANLNQMFNLLYTKVSPTGVGLGSTVQPQNAQNQINGLAHCRGDVSTTNCKACVVDASKELGQRCPHSKGAIIWYDHCLLKYSNLDFFGQIDSSNKFYMFNVKEVEYPTPFNERVKELLSGLANEACDDNGNPKLYATSEVELDASTTLYGLAQCTRDLSSMDYKKCLDSAISELPNCCDAKQGGRVVGGSCNVGYELYPIVNDP